MMQNLVATPESASLDGPQCLSLQYMPCVPVSPHPMAAKLPCSKRRVSSQPPATQLSSTATNCASCSAWFDPSQSQGTWKCGHVMHKAKRRKSTSWRVCWTCFVASFTEFFPGFMPFMPFHAFHAPSDRFVSSSGLLHTMELRWLSQFQGLLEQGVFTSMASSVFFFARRQDMYCKVSWRIRKKYPTLYNCHIYSSSSLRKRTCFDVMDTSIHGKGWEGVQKAKKLEMATVETPVKQQLLPKSQLQTGQ